MPKFFMYKKIEIEILPGTTLTNASVEAIKLSCNYKCPVTFQFNGRVINVRPEYELNRVLAQFNNQE